MQFKNKKENSLPLLLKEDSTIYKPVPDWLKKGARVNCHYSNTGVRYNCQIEVEPFLLNNEVEVVMLKGVNGCVTVDQLTPVCCKSEE